MHCRGSKSMSQVLQRPCCGQVRMGMKAKRVPTLTPRDLGFQPERMLGDVLCIGGSGIQVNTFSFLLSNVRVSPGVQSLELSPILGSEQEQFHVFRPIPCTLYSTQVHRDCLQLLGWDAAASVGLSGCHRWSTFVPVLSQSVG